MNGDLSFEDSTGVGWERYGTFAYRAPEAAVEEWQEPDDGDGCPRYWRARVTLYLDRPRGLLMPPGLSRSDAPYERIALTLDPDSALALRTALDKALLMLPKEAWK